MNIKYINDTNRPGFSFVNIVNRVYFVPLESNPVLIHLLVTLTLFTANSFATDNNRCGRNDFRVYDPEFQSNDCSIDLQSRFPEHVFFRDGTQDFAFESYYILKNGKIWIKPNEWSLGIKGSWQLFEGTGLPFGNKAKSFQPGDSITSFSNDGTMLMAVSNRGRYYKWQPLYLNDDKSDLTPHPYWEDKMGAPGEGPLFLPANRDWSFSFSVDHAGEKRLTPMHDVVSYYEDIDGNKIQFGLTATVFVVDPDGQKIRYWDTGLPTSFHKAFASPERGRFVIEKISTAASTVFVIDASGKMYTVMHDYEMNGACPGLRFHYTRERRTKSEEEVMPLYAAERSLPMPDWLLQNAPTLSGYAAITRKITILQNGKGNAARELRVQGRDSLGNYGYYYKPIFAHAWNFKVTGSFFDESQEIPRAAVEGVTPRVLGKKIDKDYKGEMSMLFASTLKIELLDFYYYNSPATLRVTTKSGKTFELTFHTVDAWGVTVQSKYSPGLVGTIMGEPKLLFGTIEIPAPTLNSADAEIKDVVETYFKRFNLVPFAFSISANDQHVQIESHVIRRDSDDYWGYSLGRKLKINVFRALDPKDVIEIHDGFTHIANAAPLKVLELEDLTEEDLPELHTKIAANYAMLKQIGKMRWMKKFGYLRQGAVSFFGAGVYLLFDGVINVFGVPSYHTLAGGLSRKGSDVMLDYMKMNFKMAFHRDEDFRQANNLLVERIRVLELKERDLTAKSSKKKLK